MIRYVAGKAGGWLVLSVLCASTSTAQAATDAAGARSAVHGRVLAEIGRSGLRSLLSASGSLGDLQNRAGSYRLAIQLELARTAPLEGRIGGLDAALEDPGLGPEERDRLTRLRNAAALELATVPRYAASYRTATAQVEALRPFGFLGERPVFLLVRGRGHVRWGGEGLTVLSEGGSVGPAVVVAGRWIVSPGLALGRTDADIRPFSGRSSSTSAGPRLELGGLLAEGWSASIQLGHAWSRNASVVVRPGPGDATEVHSSGWTRATAVTAEVMGRVQLRGSGAMVVSLRPRVGAFLVSAHGLAAADEKGGRTPGRTGGTETLAALRAGASVAAGVGAFSPSLYLGWERELTGPSNLIDDRRALLAAAGLGWSWARGRRLVGDVAVLRGRDGLRRVSEVTLVLILDG